MKTFIGLIAAELRRIRSKTFLIVTLVAVVVLPLLYGALYLWAFWDPYDVTKFPFGLVNDDIAKIKEDKEYRFGSDLVDTLLDSKDIHMRLMSKENAESQLNERKIYAYIYIPANFTEKILTSDTGSPERAVIEYKSREATNYLASRLLNSASKEIVKSLNYKISEEFFDHIFIKTRDSVTKLQDAVDGTDKLANGLSDAKDGNQKITDGLQTAANGSWDLKNGLQTLFDGATSLKDGIGTLFDGSGKLKNGITQASNSMPNLISGTQSLQNGLNQLHQGHINVSTASAALSAGSKQVLDGVTSLHDSLVASESSLLTLQAGIASSKDAISQANALLAAYISSHPESTSSAELVQAIALVQGAGSGMTQINNSFPLVTTSTQTMIDGTARLIAGQSQVYGGLTLLNTNSKQLEAGSTQALSGTTALLAGEGQLHLGLSQLVSGGNDLSNGLATAKNGSSDLRNGASDARDGAQKLNDGITKAKDGSTDLGDGLQKAYDGSTELNTKLADAKNTAEDESNIRKTDAMKPILAQPTELKEYKVLPVPNNGTAFSAYFIPLSLWVGSTALFFLISATELPDKKKRASNFVVILEKFSSLAIFSTLQTLLLDTVLIQLLHLHVQFPLYFYLFTILMGWCFTAIMQNFSCLFGEDAGKFFAIVILMLQLTSGAGTYPLESNPHFFQMINPYLPMTYGIKGLRELVSGNDLLFVVEQVKILAGYFVGFLLLTITTSKLWFIQNAHETV